MIVLQRLAKAFWVFLFLSLMLVSSAIATVRQGAEEVGHGIKHMGVQTGQAIQEGGKEIGQGLKKVGEGTGQAVQEKGREAGQAGHAAAEKVKQAARSAGDWFHDAYRSTVRTFTRFGEEIRDYFAGKGEREH